MILAVLIPKKKEVSMNNRRGRDYSNFELQVWHSSLTSNQNWILVSFISFTKIINLAIKIEHNEVS